MSDGTYSICMVTDVSPNHTCIYSHTIEDDCFVSMMTLKYIGDKDVAAHMALAASLLSMVMVMFELKEEFVGSESISDSHAEFMLMLIYEAMVILLLMFEAIVILLFIFEAMVILLFMLHTEELIFIFHAEFMLMFHAELIFIFHAELDLAFVDIFVSEIVMERWLSTSLK